MAFAAARKMSHFSLSMPTPRTSASLYRDRALLLELEGILSRLFSRVANGSSTDNYELLFQRLEIAIPPLEERLVHSLKTRRMARGMLHLPFLLNALSTATRSLNRLILLLDVADDFVVRLIYPRTGWQGNFHLEGVESNRHLLEMIMPILARELGPTLNGNPFVGLHTDQTDGTPIFRSPFALFEEPGICTDRNSLAKWESQERIWDWIGPRDFPKIDGIPTAYLGDLSQPHEWPRERLFSEMECAADLI